jgi:hypothetical protein
MRTMPTASTMANRTVKTPPALLASSATTERLKIMKLLSAQK